MVEAGRRSNTWRAGRSGLIHEITRTGIIWTGTILPWDAVKSSARHFRSYTKCTFLGIQVLGSHWVCCRAVQISYRCKAHIDSFLSRYFNRPPRQCPLCGGLQHQLVSGYLNQLAIFITNLVIFITNLVIFITNLVIFITDLVICITNLVILIHGAWHAGYLSSEFNCLALTAFSVAPYK